MTRRRILIACALICLVLAVVLALGTRSNLEPFQVAPSGARVSVAGVPRTPTHVPETREAAAETELTQLLASSALRTADDLSVARVRAGAAAKSPWWNAPLRDVHAALASAARSGNVEAMHALGSRSLQCQRSFREDTPSRLLAALRNELERIEDIGNPNNHAIQRLNATIRARQSLATYQSCTALGPAKVAGALDWVERAGRAGSERARLLYAESVLEAYKDDRGALIADIEVVAQRRELARRWIEAGVEAGNERALDTYAGALYGEGGLYGRDLFEAATYSYVLDLVRQRRMNEFDKTWRQGPHRNEEWLTPEQWDQVHVRGHDIFNAKFRDTPLWPDQG